MSDFKAKVGMIKREKSNVWKFGIGKRNKRGNLLVNFLEKDKIIIMNIFAKNQISITKKKLKCSIEDEKKVSESYFKQN